MQLPLAPPQAPSSAPASISNPPCVPKFFAGLLRVSCFYFIFRCCRSRRC